MRSIRFYEYRRDTVEFNYSAGDYCLCLYSNGHRFQHICGEIKPNIAKNKVPKSKFGRLWQFGDGTVISAIYRKI